MSDEAGARDRLAARVATLEAEITRIRAENAEAAEAFRAEPTDAAKGRLKRGAHALAEARDRLGTATASLDVFDRTGSPYGVVAEGGRVTGMIGVLVKGGSSREDRERAVDAVLGPELERACEELGVVLATSPANYAKEHPGRDPEGRTVLEVGGRVEGDRLMPAISRASKKLRD